MMAGDRAGVRNIARAALPAAGVFCLTAAAHAAVEISSKHTKNMSCVGGVCSPTAAKATLNVTHLANMLAGGDVTVQSGNVAQDVEVNAALSWTSTHRLTLDSFHSIAFNDPITVSGTGALTIKTNDGHTDGDFTFLKKGSVKFWDSRSNLVINGKTYRLMESLRAFAKGLRHDDGFGEYFAQMKNWGENGKIYAAPPINVEFDGTFEGLGNSISHLTVNSTTGYAGLFNALGVSSIVRDLQLTSVDITNNLAGALVGGLAGGGEGLVQNVSVSGQVKGAGPVIGGLLGTDFGTVIACSSSASVQGGNGTVAGGLVGHKGVQLGEDIIASYATGNVSNGGGAAVGGLVGEATQGGTISDSFATGSVTGSGTAPAGGLIGTRATDGGSTPLVQTSYSTGAVSSGAGAPVGGSIGEDDVAGSGISDDYWDLETSGVSNPHQGAGNVPDDPGITGLTDMQLKSGLPAGFDPTIWAINPKINNGYPYLINNPPLK
jgi:hypothetical protein